MKNDTGDIHMPTIAEIKKELQQTDDGQLSAFIEAYAADERDGVQKLLSSAKKRIKRLAAERERIEALKFFEKKYAEYSFVCGIDEAGRGPLAGPVVAGAVIFPKDVDILYINDSKKLSAAKREELYDVIRDKAAACAVGIVEAERIDEINILQATYEAMRKAIFALPEKPQILLNDAVTIPDVDIRQVAIIKGDAKSISIGAASILAKVTRDRMMIEYDEQFPGYGFAKHKGYGTAEHYAAIRRMGLSPIHRKSFLTNL